MSRKKVQGFLEKRAFWDLVTVKKTMAEWHELEMFRAGFPEEFFFIQGFS